MIRLLMKKLGQCAVLTAATVVTASAAAITPAMPAHASFTLHSAILGESRLINVYTPPGYALHAETRYPVLYMPDGGMQEDFPHVASDVDQAIRDGRMRPMIVVGIENTERRRDMTGPTRVASDRRIAPHVGGSAAFRAFIARELMPAVRRRYRSNGHDAIIGESLAGLFVVETFLLQPNLFDTCIAFSPSLWWNDQALAKEAGERLEHSPALRRTLYFATSSDDDIDAAAEELQAALRAHAPKQLNWFYETRPDLQHSTIYVGASPQVLRRLFPIEWKQAPASQP